MCSHLPLTSDLIGALLIGVLVPYDDRSSSLSDSSDGKLTHKSSPSCQRDWKRKQFTLGHRYQKWYACSRVLIRGCGASLTAASVQLVFLRFPASSTLPSSPRHGARETATCLFQAGFS